MSTLTHLIILNVEDREDVEYITELAREYGYLWPCDGNPPLNYPLTQFGVFALFLDITSEGKQLVYAEMEYTKKLTSRYPFIPTIDLKVIKDEKGL